ncbi:MULTISPECIES: response regulator transcription factor [Paenibacillus]|uniref:Two-component sensor response regulator n=1 Tax=Paenibacillus albilobatus TaxID=2716884 RepID=A0A919XD07_9BACL|nr:MULTISPECIES: response regulator [Paenibacillus]GIO29896.1 putative two-component sensor response regulator [Paenibacillus albilobatus]
MYKALIVDDEILDLEGMRTFIPWTELGLEVVDAVHNGFEAMSVIEKENIDVLVTDVHMPGMSGLDLVRKAKERYGRIKVIFVSGYQDFNYVKQAISLHAYNYVLKPMDDMELTEALKKIVQELDAERQREKTEQAYRQTAKNEYLLQLLEGSVTAETESMLLEQYGLKHANWPARAAALEIDDLGWKLEGLSEHLKQEWFNKFYESALPIFEAGGIRHIGRTSKQRIFLLIEYGKQEPDLEQIIRQLHELQPHSVTIGLGCLADGLTRIRTSYGEALAALDYKLLLGKGKVIRHDKLEAEREADIQAADMPLETLLNAVLHFDLVNISDEVDRLFAAAAGMRSKVQLQYFVMNVWMRLESQLKSLSDNMFQSLRHDGLPSPDMMLKYETLDDIRSWLRYRLFSAAEFIQNKRQKKSAKLVEEIIRYVREHLHDNVTLKEVADYLSFSPNYLGSLFKEVTGTNFSEYVIMMRMEKAGELLKDPRIKIYEVADRVGYRYIPYFSRQFKEVFGMTPGEFRRKV